MIKLSIICTVLVVTAACEPARRTAEFPVIAKANIAPTEVNNRNIEFVIKKPKRPLKVGMTAGISSCEVTMDHTTFLPEKVIEGLKGYYPKSTFTMATPAPLSKSNVARVTVEFLAPALGGFCNSLKCSMTAHVNAKTTITRRDSTPIEKDVFVSSDKENIDGFGLGGWCRTLPELSTATMGEIITTIPVMVREVVEAELGK